MTETRKPRHTGGCQCGAVRYALYATPAEPSVCHCRMCQKAFGSFFAPLAGVRLRDFAWVKGAPGIFKSSEAVERGFCRDCGTPLFWKRDNGSHMTVFLGSLDDAEAMPKPVEQYWTGRRIPWVPAMPEIKGFKGDHEG